MKYLKYTGNNENLLCNATDKLVKGFVYEQIEKDEDTDTIELLGIKGKFSKDLFEKVVPKDAIGEKPPMVGKSFQYKLCDSSKAKCVSQAKKILKIDDLTFIVITSRSVLKLKCTKKASSK